MTETRNSVTQIQYNFLIVSAVGPNKWALLLFWFTHNPCVRAVFVNLVIAYKQFRFQIVQDAFQGVHATRERVVQTAKRRPSVGKSCCLLAQRNCSVLARHFPTLPYRTYGNLPQRLCSFKHKLINYKLKLNKNRDSFFW